jgi:type IV pilus assembly protein PilC
MALHTPIPRVLPPDRLAEGPLLPSIARGRGAWKKLLPDNPDELLYRPSVARQQWAILQRVRVGDRLLGQFARNLGAMYAAGVPIGRAIDLMIDQPESLEWGLVIAAISRDLQSGRSLVAAFASFPRIFNPTWTALMRRALADGDLGETLEALAALHERNDRLRARIRAACAYPLMVFASSLLVALGAVAFLLPQVIGFLAASGHELPAITQALLFSVNVVRHPLFLLELPLLLYLNTRAVRRFLASEEGRVRLDDLKCRLPVLGPIFRKIALARVMHSLQATISSGMRLGAALELAADSSANAVYRLHLLRCVQGLRDGQKLSAMFASRLYDPMDYQAIRIGEECGHLDRMIGALARYHDLAVSTALESLLTMLEPVLIAATGLLVAFVVLAIFLPLYAAVATLA